MECGDQGGELFFFDVLELIDEKGQRCVTGFRGLSGRLDQGLKIVFEIPVIRETRLGLKVEANLDVAELDLETFGETGERPG